MPAPPRPNPPADVCRIAVIGTFNTAPWANVFWLRNGNASQPSQGDLATLVGNFLGLYVNNFAALMSGAVTISHADALYYGNTGADLGVSTPSGTQGGKAGGVLPANCAVVISWQVQAHYRGGHPRTYLTGLVQTDLTDATTLTPSFVTSVRQAAGNFHTGVNALSQGDFHDTHLGTVSFVLRKAWRTPPIFRDYVPGLELVDNRVDSQRRRLGRDR